MSFDLKTWQVARTAEVDAFLAPMFGDAWPGFFAEPMSYPVMGGGKRMRPLLALASFEALAGDANRQAVLHPAAAIELVHTYSLVHDDMPAMDDDSERRGKPTVHVKWDEPTAILVGDALLTEAFSVLAATPADAECRIDLVSDLAFAAGYQGMVGGQAADIGLGAKVADVETLQRLHAGKTGALIRSAVTMGARVAGANKDQMDALREYGEAVGLAFQLADDILDKDEAEDEDGPPSYVRLLGEEETLRRAKELAVRAEELVSDLPNPAALIALARYTVERDH